MFHLADTHGNRTSYAVAWVVLTFLAGGVRAADFCAVTLHVRSPDGGSIGARVQVVDDSEKVILDVRSQGGPVEICDLPFGPHRLIVGHENPEELRGCVSTTIRDVEVLRNRPVVLVAVLNPCIAYETESNGCWVYFRVRSTSGEPIAGAIVSPSPLIPEVSTDRFGRAWFPLVPEMSPQTVVVSREEYKSASLSIQCPRPKARVEHEVVLAPAS